MQPQPESKKAKTTEKHDTLYFENHPFTHAYEGDDWDILYCKYKRSCKCTSKLRVYKEDNWTEYKGDPKHSNQCITRNHGICGVVGPIVNGIIGDDIVNASEEVKCLVDIKCREEMIYRPPKDIANEIIKEMNEKYTKWTGITLNQMVNRVYNTRKDLKGDDVFRTIEEDIFRFANDGESSFLQFHTTWAGDKKQLQRIIGFGHQKLMKKLKGSKHIFFDGTFKTTPKPFKQVWIIMVWDDKDDIYIPVM